MRKKNIPIKILVYPIVLFLLFFLGSCGAKRKTVNSSGNIRPNNSSEISSSNSKSSKSNLTKHYAELLGTGTKELNSSLYQMIDEWMGIPHRMGGSTKSGVDCSGFVSMVYQQVYGKNLARRSKDMAEHIKKKYDNQLKEGDLVFFSFGGRDIDHVGIYLHNDKFVHVSTKQGVVISNLKDTWYYKYLTRCGTPTI